MKNFNRRTLFLFFFVSLGIHAAPKGRVQSPSKSSFKGSCRNFLAASMGKFPKYPGINNYYWPPGLSKKERREILGIPPKMTDYEIRDTVNVRDSFSSYSMFGNAVAYVKNIKEVPKSFASPTLFEYRYSVLRDLLTEISNTPGVDWSANDYRSPDGSVVFQGGKGEVLIIKKQDGSLYRGEGHHGPLIDEALDFSQFKPVR